MSKLKNIRKKDVLVLRDYHTLEAVGDEFQGQITEKETLTNDKMVYNMVSIEPDEDTELVLVERYLKMIPKTATIAYLGGLETILFMNGKNPLNFLNIKKMIKPIILETNLH